MKLEPKIDVPERIILFGHPGCGKSTAALSIARYTGGDMYVVDTDYSHSYARQMATEFTDLEDRVHVTPVDSDSWEEILPAVRDAARDAKKGDWVVLDSISPTWAAVQTSYIQRRHGEDFLDVFALSGRDADRTKADAEMNWPAINAEYNKLYKALMSTPAHVLITAELDAVGEKDDAKIKELYGALGLKPRGQKSLGHLTHTVLIMRKNRQGDRLVTTVKDRGREELEDQPVDEFGRDYLLKVAGWRPLAAPAAGSVPEGE